MWYLVFLLVFKFRACFSREALMNLVWHILGVLNWICVTIAALQVVAKS